MPSHVDELFAAVKASDYAKAKTLIESYPDEDLVNAVTNDNDKDHILERALLYRKPCKDFILFILSHPKFNSISYNNEENDISNIEAVITISDPEILDCAMRNPQFLFDGNKLSYETAKAALKIAETGFNREMSKDPNSAASNTLKERLVKRTHAVDVIRDASIRFAISTDDDRLFERLDKLGAKPVHSLLNGEHPSRMISAEKNPRLTAWFKAVFEKANQGLADNSFFNRQGHNFSIIQKTAQELAALKIQEKQGEANIQLQSIDKSAEKAGNMQRSLQ